MFSLISLTLINSTTFGNLFNFTFFLNITSVLVLISKLNPIILFFYYIFLDVINPIHILITFVFIFVFFSEMRIIFLKNAFYDKIIFFILIFGLMWSRLLFYRVFNFDIIEYIAIILLFCFLSLRHIYYIISANSVCLLGLCALKFFNYANAQSLHKFIFGLRDVVCLPVTTNLNIMLLLGLYNLIYVIAHNAICLSVYLIIFVIIPFIANLLIIFLIIIYHNTLIFASLLIL